MDDAPAQRYYASLVGTWEGRFRVRVTNRGELARLPLLTRMTALSAQLASPMWMRTTLEGRGRSYRHTTRVRAWGVTAFTTEETIELSDDGRSLRMSGIQRPSVGTPETYEATGSIDETASRATYELVWLACPLVQRTRIVPEGLELMQDTAWSHADVVLRRT